MKKLIEKNKVKSENRRLLTRFMLIALMSGLFLIALFYLVEMNHIQSSAILAIESAKTEGKYEEGKLPIAYTIYADELDKGVFTDLENRLVSYYLNNEDKIPIKKISKFERDDTKVFFMPIGIRKNGKKFIPKDGALIVYADVTFTVNLVKKTVVVLFEVLGFITILLILISRYFGNILDEKDDRVKRFFANASHELKTPLMSIQGNIDGIRSGYVNTKNGCQVIEREIERMTKLISDILELSKLDSGVMVPNMQKIDVRETLYDAMNVIEPIALQKNIKIKENMLEPVFKTCDEEMLFSAFSNILTNSVRYAVSKIEIDLIEDKKGTVYISISNDGDILEAEEKAHIFDRFYKGRRGQSGIGLSLSKEYIKLQGGEINILTQGNITMFQISI